MQDHEQTLPNLYKRALVTGGGGFIGSHLADKLLSLGLDVVCLDDFSAGKEANIRHNFTNPRFKSVKADVSNIEELRPHFKDVDLVFHQACSKNTVCMNDPARDLAVNGTGTLNVLLCARDAGVRRVVHASTGSVYGEPQHFPTDETHALAPVSYYGVSKLAGEKYAILFNSLHDRDVVALRYFHVYGPRQDNSDVGGVVSIFCRRAHEGQNLIIYGDGTQVRSFTHVGDVVRINLLAAVHPNMPGNAFNCASGVRITIKELADRVIAHFGNAVDIDYRDWKPGDIRNFNVDNRLIRSFGFEFEKDFEDGLLETLVWTRSYLEKRAA